MNSQVPEQSISPPEDRWEKFFEEEHCREEKAEWELEKELERKVFNED